MEDVRTFVNPKGYWSYRGAFVVTLFPGTPTGNVPSDIAVDGHVVTVTDGEVGQSMGGISMKSDGRDFHWGYRMIQHIMKSDGSLLWVNDKLRATWTASVMLHTKNKTHFVVLSTMPEPVSLPSSKVLFTRKGSYLEACQQAYEEIARLGLTLEHPPEGD